MKRFLLPIFFLSFFATVFTGCKKEDLPPPVQISACDPAQGGTREKCAALGNYELRYAGEQGIGNCRFVSGPLGGISGGVPTHQIQVAGRAYPMNVWDSGWDDALVHLRTALLNGLCF